jgi:hypothetical protein
MTLDNRAHLDQVGQFLAIGLLDECAPMRQVFYQALNLQLANGFPDWRAADAEFACQQGGREPCAWGQISLQ